MPNYRGLNVLQYECDVLKAKNMDDEIRIWEFKDAPYLSQEQQEHMVELYQSSINERNAKIEKYLNIISDYSTDNDSTSSYISYDPLEALYQEFLGQNLNMILRQLETFFENYRSALLNDSIIYFSSSAKKVATYSLHHHAAEYIVKEFLLKEQIKELELPWVSKEKSKSAIRDKYDYYADRIQCCAEIGNKIRELL